MTPLLPVWLSDRVTPDLDRAMHYTLLWGLEGVVFRTVGGADDRVPFVNERKVQRRLAEHDLACAAADPGVFEGDVSDRLVWMNERAELAETFAFCKRIGCSTVITGALAQTELDAAGAGAALRSAGDAAARAGIVLAVRNEASTACASGEALAAVLAAADHPNVRAAWSPADALEAGHDPSEGLAALAGRVALVLVRDGEVREGAWAKAVPGEGAVGWEAQLGGLLASGYDGPLCLLVSEYPRAQAGAREAHAMIQLARKARRAAREA